MSNLPAIQILKHQVGWHIGKIVEQIMITSKRLRSPRHFFILQTKSVVKHLSVVLVFAAASASNAGEPEKSCANIKDYIAFELATNIRSVCVKSDVDMPRSKLRATFNSMLSEEEASPATCAADCEVLSAMKGITIQECIDNIQVGQFVNTFMEKGVFNSDTCTDMKNRME